MKRLALEEMEMVSGGVSMSLSSCMVAMIDWGIAIDSLSAAAQSDDPTKFAIASYKAMMATDKVTNVCNEQ